MCLPTCRGMTWKQNTGLPTCRGMTWKQNTGCPTLQMVKFVKNKAFRENTLKKTKILSINSVIPDCSEFIPTIWRSFSLLFGFYTDKVITVRLCSSLRFSFAVKVFVFYNFCFLWFLLSEIVFYYLTRTIFFVSIIFPSAKSR